MRSQTFVEDVCADVQGVVYQRLRADLFEFGVGDVRLGVKLVSVVDAALDLVRP